MRRALFCLFLAFAIILTSFPCFAATEGEPSVSAKSAILIDLYERNVLYEKNSRVRMPMASTTKIITALVASELLAPDASVRIPREAVGIEGSSIYLCEGELLTVEQLLYALLLESANDAAVALAIAAAGSTTRFASECNKKAAELGLRDTNFKNPHGLYDEDHYTTAYDLAVISAEALQSELLRKIFATKNAKIPLGATPENPSGSGCRSLKNHNKMLSLYESAIGMKTGFTKKSGRCLVSAAEKNGLTLIAVTLNAPDDWRDHTSMLNYGFERYEYKTVYEAGEFLYNFPLSNAEAAYAKASNLSPIKALIRKGERISDTDVEATFRFAIAPIKKGQILGRVCVTVGKKRFFSTLAATEEICAKKEKFSLFNKGS